MKYLPPFSALKRSVRLLSVKGQLKLDMNYDEFLDMVKLFLRAMPFDEAWYRRTYPDVAQAIHTGTYRDARQHFIESGYFEGRRPFPLEVDEAWYIAKNSDVAESVRNGTVASAQEHFEQHGYEEGRWPGEV